MAQKKFVVIGIGRFGSVIAKTLMKRGAEVMVIDRNTEIINNIADEVSSAVVLDATDKKALISQNISEFDAAVVSIGDDFEQRLLCSSLLLDLGVKRIIVRASGKNQRTILKKIGIREILSPEDEVGMNVAERLINPSIMAYFELPDGYEVAEVIAPPDTVGRKTDDIEFLNRYNIILLTVKKEITKTGKKDQEDNEFHVTGLPTGDAVIQKNDYLIIFGKKTNIDKFIEINQ